VSERYSSSRLTVVAVERARSLLPRELAREQGYSTGIRLAGASMNEHHDNAATSSPLVTH
jgi:hypothetical protein